MPTADLVQTAIRKPQRPDLTSEQRRLLLVAAGEMIYSVCTGRPTACPGPSLAGIADLPVSGVFVSLKRRKHLRGCCGGLQEQPLPLGRALADAVARTVLEDARFPLVSPCELAHLEVEVWLLFNPQSLQVRGEACVAEIVIGRHGLVVTRGGARGLLLPGVAVEHGWNARRFLEQVCVKAGLHPSLWKDEGTSLLTFEGESLRGPVLDGDREDAEGPSRLPLTRADLPAYAEFCRNNLWALLNGALPTYYLFDKPDVTVSGVILSLRWAGQPGSLDVSRVGLRPGVPLQATLFSLTQAAAQALAAQAITAADFRTLRVGLTVLGDPALHGTVSDPDFGGLDAGSRAVLVVERSRTGIVYDPQQDAAERVAEAARQARVHTPVTAAVFSLEAVATEPAVLVSTAPRPVPGPAVRVPGVAGKFYPGDPAELSRLVEQLLGDDRTEEPWPAALVPHAGLLYSGHIAAKVLRRLWYPQTILVIGPKHTPHGMEWAVAPHQTWSLPGGSLASDPVLARRLSEAIPGLALDSEAHRQEHALEVELPFLARLAPQSRVVGIAIGHGDLESCYRFAGGLAELIRGMDELPLLLVSSDMNHFATDAENRRLDELALRALEGLDPAEVYETVTDNHISMCGLLPAVIVLEALRQLGRLSRAERVGYATSGDVTGDRSRVVGYAGLLFG